MDVTRAAVCAVAGTASVKLVATQLLKRNLVRNIEVSTVVGVGSSFLL
jgi:hypothetical protein